MMHHLTFYYFPHIFFKNSVLPCFTGKKVLPVVIPVNHWFGKTSKTTTLLLNSIEQLRKFVERDQSSVVDVEQALAMNVTSFPPGRAGCALFHQ